MHRGGERSESGATRLPVRRREEVAAAAAPPVDRRDRAGRDRSTFLATALDAVRRAELRSESPEPDVRELTAAQSTQWDRYVERRPDATLFHELSWRRAVERAFGHRARYLTALRGDRVVGVLPLFEIDSIVAGRMLVSVPYATYGGPLTEDSAATRALLNAARRMLVEWNARSLEIRSITAADPTHEIADRHVTFIKDLPADPDNDAAMMPRKARAAARRAAERYGLTTSFEPGLLATVWKLYARSMRRLGSPNYPQRFFEALRDEFSRRALVQVTTHGNRPVAGLLSFVFRDTVMPYFAGIDERPGLYGLNQYMYLQLMRRAVEHGFRRFDFGRSRIDNRGAYDFKRRCGLEPRPLEYQIYTAPGRTAPNLSPGATRWALARRCWSRLPLQFTRPVGGWLARSFPG